MSAITTCPLDFHFQCSSLLILLSINLLNFFTN